MLLLPSFSRTLAFDQWTILGAQHILAKPQSMYSGSNHHTLIGKIASSLSMRSYSFADIVTLLAFTRAVTTILSNDKHKPRPTLCSIVVQEWCHEIFIVIGTKNRSYNGIVMMI